MKILLTSQAREADKYTIDNEPILSINLMERAARQCANWITQRFTHDTKFKVFAGQGNNGGDGLAIARLLINSGYTVDIYVVKFSDKASAEFTINYNRLLDMPKVKINALTEDDKLCSIKRNNVVIDALFGSGLSKPLTDFPAKVVNHINKSKASIISIDIPSGLFGEENATENDAIIHATHTLTFEYPFISFFFPENERYVGNFHVLPIGISRKFTESVECSHYTLIKSLLAAKLLNVENLLTKAISGTLFSSPEVPVKWARQYWHRVHV